MHLSDNVEYMPAGTLLSSLCPSLLTQKNWTFEEWYVITMNIEDVERGAELSFSGPLRGPPSRPLRGPCIIVKFCLHQILVSDRRTDGRTDGQ